MAKIIIEDLEQDIELDRQAMTVISGGFNPQPEPPRFTSFARRKRFNGPKRDRGRSCNSSGGRGDKARDYLSAKGITIIYRY